jgi:hypothetical protein
VEKLSIDKLFANGHVGAYQGLLPDWLGGSRKHMLSPYERREDCN